MFRRAALSLLLSTLVALLQCDGVRAQGTGARRHWAVIVGIDAYPGLAPLKYCEADAAMFQEALGSASDRVLLLTTLAGDPAKRPTRANILRALTEIAAKTAPGDFLWFYFSGHGIELDGASHLVPVDFRLHDRRSFLPVSEIRALVEDQARCKAASRLVILDACHSGSSRTLADATTHPGLEGWRGTITAAASRPDRKAWESDELGHGLFTYYLVRGLAGMGDADSDAAVSLAELRSYVAERVNEACRKRLQPEQDPQFHYRGDPKILVSARDEALLTKYPDVGGKDLALVPRQELNPGLIVLIGGERGSGVQAEVKSLFAEKGFPLLVDEAARQFEAVLRGADTEAVAAQVRRLNSRFLLRGKVASTRLERPDPLGSGSCRAYATVEAELTDIQGRSLGSFFETRNAPGTADEDAYRHAIKAVARRLMERMAPEVERVLKRSE